jgi:hypothetical protein
MKMTFILSASGSGVRAGGSQGAGQGASSGAAGGRTRLTLGGGRVG